MAIKETGLMFIAPLVLDIKNGKKTNTCRLVQVPRKRPGFVMLDHGRGWWPYQSDDGESAICDDGNEHPYKSPYGMPDDQLYVRETWQHANFPLGPYQEETPVFYRADYLDDPHGPDGEKSPEGKYRIWTPSIHMPKAAARIWLEVTKLQVHRLHDISEADASREGLQYSTDRMGHWCGNGKDWQMTARQAFRDLWIATGGDWDANPWVWNIGFKLLSTTGKPQQ